VFSFTIDHNKYLYILKNITYIFVIPKRQQIDQKFANKLKKRYRDEIATIYRLAKHTTPHVLLAFPSNTSTSESNKSHKNRVKMIEMPPLNFHVLTRKATDDEIFQEIATLAVQIDSGYEKLGLDETLLHKLKRKQSICYSIAIVILVMMGSLAMILYGSGKKDYKE
jgi:hypothetical protein